MKYTNTPGPDVHPESPVVLVRRDEKLQTVHRIRLFRVGTDSVVATATISVIDATRRIEIDWGDGTSDVIRNHPGSTSLPAPGTNPLPEGSYRIQHAYSVSEDGRAFEHFVQVRTDDADGSFDFSMEKITITPRWRVVHYPISVRLASNCDPFYNNNVTIKVIQTIDGEPVNSYNWEASNSFFGPSQFFFLEGSGTSTEVEAPPAGQPAEGKSVTFEFTEHDIITSDETNRISLFLSWVPAVLDGNISERIERTNSGGCEIIYAFDREITLLVPIDQVNPGIFAPLG